MSAIYQHEILKKLFYEGTSGGLFNIEDISNFFSFLVSKDCKKKETVNLFLETIRKLYFRSLINVTILNRGQQGAREYNNDTHKTVIDGILDSKTSHDFYLSFEQNSNNPIKDDIKLAPISVVLSCMEIELSPKGYDLAIKLIEHEDNQIRFDQTKKISYGALFASGAIAIFSALNFIIHLCASLSKC